MQCLTGKVLNMSMIFMPAFMFLAFWEFAVHDSARLTFLFAAPSLVVETAFREYAQGAIWQHIGITLFEALSGLVLGSFFGVLAALSLWGSKTAQKIARPYIALIGSIPIFALAPMLIIWLGVGIMAKVAMAAFGVFIITLVQVFEGMQSTTKQHVIYAESLGARKIDIMRKILLPSAARWLITALRINVGIAFLGVFIGEFVSSQAGLGHYIIEAGQTYDMPAVLFGIVNLSALALIMDYALGRIIPRRYMS